MSDIQIVGGVDAAGVPVELSVIDGMISVGSDGPPDFDAQGLAIVPGFIDIQTNGAYGFDFTEDPNSMWDVGAQLPEQGVTSFCPTIITACSDRIARAQAAIADRPKGYVGAEPIGIHAEGPYISMAKRGTHPIAHLRDAAPNEFDTTGIAIVTVAPELAGVTGFIERLTSAGVVVSLGHSAASARIAAEAIDAGATLGTHLFNAMPPLIAREPGLAGILLTDQRTYLGLIVDGIHLANEMLMIAWSLGRDRFLLITDSISATGMPDGHYDIGGVPVEVRDGTVRNVDGALAGSILTMDQAIRNLMRTTGASLEAAVAAASSNPASALGRTDIGSLAVGSRGDVVLLDGAEVVATVIAGRIVFCNQPDRLIGGSRVTEI